ncbi:hypothetical protein VTO73DRAFT_2558 [Trametes versicolor]
MLLHTSAEDLAAPYIIARPPILDVGSARALSLAKFYIDECLHGHGRCIHVSPSSDVRLPTRLVDCTDPNCMRLVSTEGGHGKYLALSYVWGEPQPHQTTTSNVSVYMDGIDASLLPRTLRDAIRVTHTLGFQYLWVDSLCIIQDEDKDRVHEIGWMHLVYRYAHLTIVAASARRVSDGFLQNRLAEDVVQITLPFFCPPPPSPSLLSLRPPCPQRPSYTNITTIYGRPPGPSPPSVARQVGRVHVSFPDITQRGDRPYDPIHERGWCLQEFYLSPRALIFSGQALQFRCQKDTQNIGKSFYNTIADIQLPDILLHRTPPHAEYGTSVWSEVHSGWSQIVALYTRRVIGKWSDKLVACGALAEACNRVLRADYLAGLWRDTLLHDLLCVSAPLPSSNVASIFTLWTCAVEGSVEKLAKNPEFAAQSLRKITALIKARVYPLKATTKEQLQEMCIEMQEMCDNIVEERDAALAHIAAHEEADLQRDAVLRRCNEERDAAVRERDAALEREHLRAEAEQTASNAVQDEDPDGERAMEIESDDDAYVSATSLPPTPPPTAPSAILRTLKFKHYSAQGAATPVRSRSQQSCLTPPPTEVQSHPPLGRPPSPISYLDPEEQPSEMLMNNMPGQYHRLDASSETPSPPQRYTSPPATTSAHADDYAVTFASAHQMLYALEAQHARREQERDRKDQERDRKEKELSEQLAAAKANAYAIGQRLVTESKERERLAREFHTLQNEIAELQRALADSMRRFTWSEARREEQMLECHEARGEVAHLRRRTAALSSQVVRIVEANAGVLTFANTRVTELTAEVVDDFDSFVKLKVATLHLTQWVSANVGQFAQNLEGQWPAAW